MNKGAAKYHCPNCGRYFNDLTKTIFEHHKFPIEEMEKRRGRKGIKQDRPRKRGLRRRGRGTYDGDKPPVQTVTERRGKTRFFVKRKLSRDNTKNTLKTVSEGEIRVDTEAG